MGQCVPASEESREAQLRAAEEKKRSQAIENAASNWWNQSQRLKRLLLLGAGESGKSTLFKQARVLYGEGYSDEQRRNFRQTVVENVIDGCRILLRMGKIYYRSKVSKLKDVEDRLNQQESFEIHFISEELAKDIKTIWNFPEIKKTFERRSEFQLQDSLAYFLNRIDMLVGEDYTPTFQDVLLARRKTTGVIEMEITMDGEKLKLVDVGGQRNERRKWIHQFDVCSGIIFVVAINEFDQCLAEDSKTNRVMEALFIFEQMVNSSWFADMNIILFFNKRDLFKEKLDAGKSIDLIFPEFKGGSDFGDSCKFLKKVFGAKNFNPQRAIYCHVTCATDTHHIKSVFDDLVDILLRDSLHDTGFM